MSIDTLRMPAVVAAATLVVLGGCATERPNFSPAPTSPDRPSAASPNYQPTETVKIDLRDLLTSETVGDKPLPVGEIGSGVCAKDETTRDANKHYSLEAGAAEALIDRLEAATGYQPEVNSDGAPLFEADDGRGGKTYVQVGYIKGKPDIAYVDTHVGGVDNAQRQLFLYREGVQDDEATPDCQKKPTWVVALDDGREDGRGVADRLRSFAVDLETIQNSKFGIRE